uniref:Uncharacterized protein n=1 Tax=Mycena chlorophos TaxID=658473 RepID=A0ABQ0L612_MYCCL|nr:predicted protein [Mycena chlorophos]
MKKQEGIKPAIHVIRRVIRQHRHALTSNPHSAAPLPVFSEFYRYRGRGGGLGTHTPRKGFSATQLARHESCERPTALSFRRTSGVSDKLAIGFGVIAVIIAGLNARAHARRNGFSCGNARFSSAAMSRAQALTNGGERSRSRRCNGSRQPPAGPTLWQAILGDARSLRNKAPFRVRQRLDDDDARCPVDKATTVRGWQAGLCAESKNASFFATLRYDNAQDATLSQVEQLLFVISPSSKVEP